MSSIAITPNRIDIDTRSEALVLGPGLAGIQLTPEQFEACDGDKGWRYELINGVVVVNPPPSVQERDPNDQLGYLLRRYKDDHPNGSALNKTLPEHDIKIGKNWRRADRVIWAGLGRHPRRMETPTIVVEFVSEGRRNWLRDYQEKRQEYLGIGVAEYWVFNRFDKTLTVYKPDGSKQVLAKDDTITTERLPGFQASMSKLLALSEPWEE